MEKFGKDWLRERAEFAKKQTKATSEKYRKLLRDLKQKETGKNAAQHAKDQEVAKKKFEAEVTKQKADVAAKDKAWAGLKAKPTKGMTDAQKKAHRALVAKAKKDLKVAERDQGVAERKIHELYASSVEQILENLRKDESRIANYEQLALGLKLARP